MEWAEVSWNGPSEAFITSAEWKFGLSSVYLVIKKVAITLFHYRLGSKSTSELLCTNHMKYDSIWLLLIIVELYSLFLPEFRPCPHISRGVINHSIMGWMLLRLGGHLAEPLNRSHSLIIFQACAGRF